MIMQSINIDYAEAEVLADLPTSFDDLVNEETQKTVAEDLRRIARARQEAAVDGAPLRMS